MRETLRYKGFAFAMVLTLSSLEGFHEGNGNISAKTSFLLCAHQYLRLSLRKAK